MLVEEEDFIDDLERLIVLELHLKLTHAAQVLVDLALALGQLTPASLFLGPLSLLLGDSLLLKLGTSSLLLNLNHQRFGLITHAVELDLVKVLTTLIQLQASLEHFLIGSRIIPF